MLEKYINILKIPENIKEYFLQMKNPIFNITLCKDYTNEELENLLKNINYNGLTEIGKSEYTKFYLDLMKKNIKCKFYNGEIEVINKSLETFLVFLSEFDAFQNYHTQILKVYRSSFDYEDFVAYLDRYVQFRKRIISLDEEALFSHYWANYFFPDITGLMDDMIANFLIMTGNEIPRSFVDYFLLEKLGQIGYGQEIFDLLDKNSDLYYKEYFDIHNPTVIDFNDSIYRLEQVFFGADYRERGLEKLKAMGFNPDFLKDIDNTPK